LQDQNFSNRLISNQATFYLTSEIITVVIIKISVFWEVTPYSLVDYQWIFRINPLPPTSDADGGRL
jgi:hypothetical protein